MNTLRYSQRSKVDLKNIAIFTLQKWGENQVIRYLNQLDLACDRLTSTPWIGRDCSKLAPSLRRIESGSHVIFYRTLPKAVRIERILHRNQVPSKSHFGRQTRRSS